MPGLLNYTTTIEAAKTVGEIQAILAKHHVAKVLLDYDEKQQIVAMDFIIRTPKGDLPIRLPANVEAVYKVMVRDYNANSRRRVVPTKEQATRVAWRILKDWVAAQLAIIETEMVSIEEVFMPYVLANDNKTFFQHFNSGRLQITSGGPNQ